MNVLLMSGRWQRLLADADARKQRLLRLQEQYRQVEDLYQTFAKKALGERDPGDVP